jgi:dipeptidase D
MMFLPPAPDQAQGTTLGADNGIGVATALALLDQAASVTLPPLECLFTVDEETGLTGAFDLDGSMLSGAAARGPSLC